MIQEDCLRYAGCHSTASGCSGNCLVCI